MYKIDSSLFYLLFTSVIFWFLQQLELPMLKVAATEMVSGVSGESEQKLRELFDQALVRSMIHRLVSIF